MVQDFVRHANAILDSLNRFEFTKARYANLLNQYAQGQQQQLSLLVRIEELQRQNEQLNTALTKTQIQLDEERRKKRAKAWENWFWRALAGGLIYNQTRR
ncbi:hypothetical protein [Siphonobacter curvatus]|uniref:Uncharacterized protein n=1 Tax=Siphonobacter curvatus TaxID=2094562 RepID=A0A2S7IN40_9BACT|nr:hypothetical protein [Siphonobacter curvatus]PQA59151.1 hypothetical protein C5O19_05710 [Siphonobacter curvatus]